MRRSATASRSPPGTGRSTAERVRADRYAVDTTALRPYFELDRVLVDGVFHAAGLLYGYRFAPRPELAGYHPDVRVWEVSDADGAPVGLYLGDFFAREGKRGGAWMSSFVRQSRLLGTQPVVVNNLNVSRAADGQPTLLTLDEVNTLFHEFGHALHGLCSAVTYPRFSGTAVPRDFVEFPCQVNEMWALWPEVLRNYARHVETGEPLPADDREGDRRRPAVRRGLRDHRVPRRDPARPGLAPDHARRPRSGTRSRSSSRRARGGRGRLAAGRRRATAPPTSRTSSPAATRPGTTPTSGRRCWTPTPSSGSRRTVGCAGRTATRSAAELLSVGGSIDPMAAFRAVRGRDADPAPLLRRRGLVTTSPGLDRGEGSAPS